MYTKNSNLEALAVRNESSEFKKYYGYSMPAKMMCDRVSQFVQVFTLYSHVRPFGCSVMLGSYEDGESQLYMVREKCALIFFFSFAFSFV